MKEKINIQYNKVSMLEWEKSVNYLHIIVYIPLYAYFLKINVVSEA